MSKEIQDLLLYLICGSFRLHTFVVSDLKVASSIASFKNKIAL